MEHEERIWVQDSPHSWEAIDPVRAAYTPDITPLILAAHKNNYEILKILLDRGSAMPRPHDVKCSCQQCWLSSKQDSLRYSIVKVYGY